MQTKNKLTLVLVAGYPGSGKTHLSKIIANKIPIFHIDKDKINDLFSKSRTDDIFEKTKVKAHLMMYEMANKNLKQRKSVLLDAPFTGKNYFENEEWKNKIQTLAEQHGANIKVIWCTATSPIKKKRISLRNEVRDRENIDKLGTFVLESDIPSIPFEHVIFNSEDEKEAEKIFSFLGY